MALSQYMQEIRARIGNRCLEVPKVVVVLRDEAGRVLLVYQADEKWVLPGGAVEPDEVPAETAAREVREETGLDVSIETLLGVYGGPEFRITYASTGDEVSYLMVVFEGKVRGGRLRPDGEEVLECRWCAQDETAGLQTPIWVRIILDDVFAGRTGCFHPTPSSPASTDRGSRKKEATR